MDWKKLLESITKSVDEELRLRNAYLMTENRILRQQSTGRVPLTDSDRQALAEIGIQLGKQALEEIATVAKPDTILAWHRKFASPPGDISQLPKSVVDARRAAVVAQYAYAEGEVERRGQRGHAGTAGPVWQAYPPTDFLGVRLL